MGGDIHRCAQAAADALVQGIGEAVQAAEQWLAFGQADGEVVFVEQGIELVIVGAAGRVAQQLQHGCLPRGLLRA
ncbi:hypothetical protein D3C81_1826330 [compost metagenome]